MTSWTFDSRDADETLEQGEDLGRSIGAGGLAIALVGPLGAGKTVFVKGLARGLGVDPRLVSSPTFVIAQQYPIGTGSATLHHVDLYRLDLEDELETIGFYDMLAAGNVVAVEWADRFDHLLGRSYLAIEFDGPSPEEADALREDASWRGRRARVTAHGEEPERILVDWAARVENRTRLAGGSVAPSPAMRVLTMLLVTAGIFLGQRIASGSAPGLDGRSCHAPVAVEVDGLGTLRAVCDPHSEQGSQSLSGIARLLDGRSIDLNLASADLLQRLPQVGPARAAAIVRERSDRPFSSVEDLERVPGIGPRIRTSLAGWLSIGRPLSRSESPSESPSEASEEGRGRRERKDGPDG